MKEFLENLHMMVDEFGTGPKLSEMKRRSLDDKGISGPTAAHVIEEIHSPLNLAYVTFTTGSSAFQNIVGVTYPEIAGRIKASHKALELAGVKRGSKVLFAYPPLVNVFSKQALLEYDLQWFFLIRSSRDAFLDALYREKPDVIIGESSFIRTSLEDAKRMGFIEYLPKNRTFIVAGTPLDLELLQTVQEINGSVHDLYGCQEFGWLTLDGMPVREDIRLVQSPVSDDYKEMIVGGLPTGDSFIVSESGHVLNNNGKIITYRRKRTYPEYELYVKETTLSSAETILRVARTILRLKSRVVKVLPDVKTGADHTVLELRLGLQDSNSNIAKIEIKGSDDTELFDALVKAQLEYQQTSKTDPTWTKKR